MILLYTKQKTAYTELILKSAQKTLKKPIQQTITGALVKGILKKDIRKNIIPFTPSKLDGVGDIIIKNLGDINIEELKTPFAAVAVPVGQELPRNPYHSFQQSRKLI